MKQLSNFMRPDVPATGRPSRNVSVLSHWKHRMTTFQISAGTNPY
jgi:hypothetical protein